VFLEDKGEALGGKPPKKMRHCSNLATLRTARYTPTTFAVSEGAKMFMFRGVPENRLNSRLDASKKSGERGQISMFPPVFDRENICGVDQSGENLSTFGGESLA